MRTSRIADAILYIHATNPRTQSIVLVEGTGGHSMAGISTLEDLFLRLVGEPDQIEHEELDRALQQAVSMHIHPLYPPTDSSVSTPYV